MHDLVIRGGTRRRRHRRPRPTGDVAIDGGVITEVGEVDGAGAARDRRRRPARHARLRRHPHPLRRPGHLGPDARPSCWHGVTTVVMGNCGVGFAPVRPDRPRLAHRADGGRRGHPRHRAARGHRLGLGDLPRVPRRARAHCRASSTSAPGAARRGARLRDGRARRATTTATRRRHRRRWRRSCARASHAGALGSPRRARSLHRAKRRRAGAGHLRGGRRARSASARRSGEPATACSSWSPSDMARTSTHGGRVDAPSSRPSIGRPVTFALLQADFGPDLWRELIDAGSTEANADGRRHRARRWPAAPTGLLLGLQSTLHPFVATRPTREIAAPAAGRAGRAAARARGRERRSSARTPQPDGRSPRRCAGDLGRAVPARATRPTTSRRPTRSVAGLAAAREGRDAEEVALRPACSRDDGRELLYLPLLNYADGNLDDVARDARCTPTRVLGLADGGAHCGVDLRRQLARRSCSPTGPATAAAASGSRSSCVVQQADPTTRPGSTASATAACSRPGMLGRRQRHRLRRASRSSRPRWSTTCPPAASASCSGPRATSRPSSRGRGPRPRRADRRAAGRPAAGHPGPGRLSGSPSTSLPRRTPG